MGQSNGSSWVLQVEPLYFLFFSLSTFIGGCYWDDPAGGVNSDYLSTNLSSQLFVLFPWERTEQFTWQYPVRISEKIGRKLNEI